MSHNYISPPSKPIIGTIYYDHHSADHYIWDGNTWAIVQPSENCEAGAFDIYPKIDGEDMVQYVNELREI